MSHQLFKLPRQLNYNGNLQTVPGAKAYFYLSGTSTLQTVYQDADLTIPHANPVVADFLGMLPAIYMNPGVRHKLILKTSADVDLYTTDPINDQIPATYTQTSAEIAAGVTPVDYSRAPGDIRRYGATSGEDCRTAIINAINQAAQNGHDVYIPIGTWNCPDNIPLKSNVRIYGEGHTSNIVGSSWTGSGYALLYASRDAADAPYTNIIIENIRVTGALNGAVPSHSNQGAAILIAYATMVRLRNVIVDRADDACIRMEGYRAGTVFPLASSDPDVNADLGHLNDFVIEGCRCTGGYMGLEIEGGASGVVLGGYLEGGTTYAIRMPRAKNVRVIGAHLYSTNDQALWMDYVNRSVISGCTIETTDAAEPCIAIGFWKDVTLVGNTIRGGNVSVSDSVMYASTIASGGSAVIANNICDQRIQFLYHQKAIIDGNVCSFVEIQSSAKAVVRGNMGTLTVSPASKLVSRGGADVLVLDNFGTDFLPRVDDGNHGLLGAADSAPTTGTYSAGHWLWAETPTPNIPLGRVCRSGGTPGSWEDFGEMRPGNCRDFYIAGSANNVTDRAMVTITVPNTEVFLVVEALATVHRQPSSSPGTSQIQRAVFSIGRQSGSDVVIDTYTGVGEYTKTSTTAGGATSASAMNLECARTGAETATDPQAVAVRLDVSGGVRNYNVHVRVLGQFNGTTFARTNT